ncbi:MAG: DNA helicase [Phycisphaerae bacterium]|nr:MAG: DNA helicase [Phycisphaerae bacterium]
MTHGGAAEHLDPALTPLLDGLTPPQRDAVLHTEGPLLVLAAAGSGKTRVITRRIAYLVQCGVPPWNILALTFTNKAAGEMRERVLTLLGGADDRRTRGLTVTTFHALCARLLRRYASAAGLKPDFTIYDTDDQASVCKKAVEACQLTTSNFPPRVVLSAISKAKNDLLDAEAYAARAREWNTRQIASVFKTYTRLMRAANAVDFDDLLVMTAQVLRDDDAARAECRDRWRYLLVDEYQDTNHAQFVIASAIAGTERPNFCVVGDPDQSIYGWRGANIGNILDFEEHYPDCRVITLGENFRSTAPILALADALIRHNKRRKHKPLFTSRAGGDKPEAVLCLDESHEARVVTEWLKTRHDSGVPWRDMAIFYRTNALSRVMEEALRGAGVPYVIARGTAFYEREEVRNALAYLRVIANPADTVSLLRIINTPTRGIGRTSLDAVEAHAARAGEPLMESLRQASAIEGLGARAAPAIQKFVAMIDGWTGAGTFMGEAVPTTLTELVARVIQESGLRDMYAKQAKASGSESDEQRIDNLDELVSSAREFSLEFDPAADAAAPPPPSGKGSGDGSVSTQDNADADWLQTPPLLAMLRAYLESIALVADADAVDPAQGALTLMTFHAAKGLEFDSVAMIGLEEGMLPHARTLQNNAELEEERRLCFVGITRAMRRLLLTSAKSRTHRGLPERTIPSRFLSELPADQMLIADQSGFLDDDGWDDSPASGVSPRKPTFARAAHDLPFAVGSRVRHPQFGLGEVLSITPGSNARATIRFKDLGTKTLVLEYARLTPVP